MSPLRRTASIVRDQRGFTLIEMLVAILTGLIVLFATFAILNVSLSQSSRIADRVSADQRSRIAMEKIVQELHSSCVSINENPILAGSEPNKIIFVSETGSQTAFTTVTKHEISLSGGTLKDTYTTSKVSLTGSKWVFPEVATGTKTLLTGVSLVRLHARIPVLQILPEHRSQRHRTSGHSLPHPAHHSPESDRSRDHRSGDRELHRRSGIVELQKRPFGRTQRQRHAAPHSIRRRR